MEKNTLFSKLNIKDYNNELEKILDKKVFSIDIKNLLLSMLYKIENAYPDYQEVKREVPNKNTYIENIVNIIQNDCNEIEILKIKPEDEENDKEKNSKYSINRESKKIVSLNNENALLEAIIMMTKTTIKVPEHYGFLGDSYNYVLTSGYSISDSEVINDFNGWSWDITNLSPEKEACNIIFKTLLYTIGNSTLYDFIDNNNITIDYIKIINNEIIKKYGKKIGEEFKKQLYICLISTYLSENPSIKDDIVSVSRKYQEQLDRMKDKEKFVCELTFEKLKHSKEVEKIDIILNDYDQLKSKYDTLSNEEKETVISISDYETHLEKEREEHIQEIKSINNIISPKQFIKIQEDLNNKIEILTRSLNNNNETEIIKLCEVFLEGLAKNIEKVSNKKDLIEHIYELRYYRFLQIKNTYLKDIIELKEKFEYTMKLLIGKACNLKVLENVCEDYKINYEILKMIFNTKIINLKDMNYECKQKNDILYLQYFDSKMYESTVEIKVNDSIKIKKKANIFAH